MDAPATVAAPAAVGAAIAKGAAAGRKSRLAAHLFTLGVLAAWAAWGASVESYQMPGPLAVAERLGLFFTDAHEIGHMFWSFGHIIAAVVISFFIGFALALLPW